MTEERELLQALAALKRHNPNRQRNKPPATLVVNMPAALLERIDAALKRRPA